jgi:hydroxymethylglutaryl-CoA lyase
MFLPTPKFDSVVAIEVITMSKQFAGSTPRVAGAAKRRDIWESREEAYETLKGRKPWKVWDDRVLKGFVVCLWFSLFYMFSDACA